MTAKIALLLPYFGKLNNYFQLWLSSAGWNKNIDFLLFTDDKTITDYKIPKNVHYYFMNFADVKKRIENILPYKFVLHKPYKICDYRPLYGMIFSDFLCDYDFWGHCDPDVIWGDLSIVFDGVDLRNVDKINKCGHLCIYRNIDRINRMVLDVSIKGLDAHDVFTHKYCAHFDESNLLCKYLNKIGINGFSKNTFADISYFKYQFVRIIDGKEQETLLAFEFSQGRIIGYYLENNNLTSREYSYIHLQKRDMTIKIDNDNHFFVIPNEFLDATLFEKKYNLRCINDQKQLVCRKKDYEKKMKVQYRKRQITNLLEGAIFFRIKGVLSKNG